MPFERQPVKDRSGLEAVCSLLSSRFIPVACVLRPQTSEHDRTLRCGDATVAISLFASQKHPYSMPLSRRGGYVCLLVERTIWPRFVRSYYTKLQNSALGLTDPPIYAYARVNGSLLTGS